MVVRTRLGQKSTALNLFAAEITQTRQEVSIFPPHQLEALDAIRPQLWPILCSELCLRKIPSSPFSQETLSKVNRFRNPDVYSYG